MVDAPSAAMVLRAEPHKIGSGLRPCCYILHLGVVDRERFEIDRVDGRELKDFVMKLEARMSGLIQHWISLSVGTLIEAKALSHIASASRLIGTVIGVEGCIIGVALPR